MKFNQDLCLRTCGMKSTPGSVVPLTMFKMYSMIMPYRQFAINPFSFWKHLPRLILASFSPALSLWWWPAPLQILIVAASQPHLVLARQDRICGNRGPAGGPPTPQRGLQLLPHCIVGARVVVVGKILRRHSRFWSWSCNQFSSVIDQYIEIKDTENCLLK